MTTRTNIADLDLNLNQSEKFSEPQVTLLSDLLEFMPFIIISKKQRRSANVLRERGFIELESTTFNDYPKVRLTKKGMRLLGGQRLSNKMTKVQEVN